jgi:hypothetical protein
MNILKIESFLAGKNKESKSKNRNESTAPIPMEFGGIEPCD